MVSPSNSLPVGDLPTGGSGALLFVGDRRCCYFNNENYEPVGPIPESSIIVLMSFTSSQIKPRQRRGSAVDRNAFPPVLLPETQKKLNGNERLVQFPKGGFIFYQDQGAAGTHELVDGFVKLFKTTDEGRFQLMRIAGPGELLGYRAVLLRAPHNVAAEALTPVKARFIAREEFTRLLQDDPDVGMRLLRHLSIDLRETERQLLNISRKTVAQRLGAALLSLEAQHGTDDDGALQPRLTREELAGLIGAATETAVRTLSEFKERGLVRTSGRQIWILNRKRLARL